MLNRFVTVNRSLEQRPAKLAVFQTGVGDLGAAQVQEGELRQRLKLRQGGVADRVVLEVQALKIF